MIMKRLACLFCAAALLLISGCSSSREPSIGTYVYTQSQDTIKPTVQLMDDGSFIFSYSILSSYLPTGTYSCEGGILTLSTGDGQTEYCFEVGKDSLTFLADKSTALPSFAQVPDGAEFIK